MYHDPLGMKRFKTSAVLNEASKTYVVQAVFQIGAGPQANNSTRSKTWPDKWIKNINYNDLVEAEIDSLEFLPNPNVKNCIWNPENYFSQPITWCNKGKSIEIKLTQKQLAIWSLSIAFTVFYLLVFELHQMCFEWQQSDCHDPRIK